MNEIVAAAAALKSENGLPTAYKPANSGTWLARRGYYRNAKGRREQREHRPGPELGDALVRLAGLDNAWRHVEADAERVTVEQARVRSLADEWARVDLDPTAARRTTAM